MSLTDPFVRRPIMTTLVMIAILGFGLLSYTKLPVSDLPNVDFPTITVSASLPGANPETMASSVATPLEKQFSSIAGIDSMSSSSSLGSTSITLQFALSRNIDAAAQDVQTAISSAVRDLPDDMPSPPSFRKVNPSEQPILLIAATSDSLPLSKVDEFAETLIGQRLSTITGVAQVDIFGSQKFAVRVQVDPRELAARGIGIDEIETAVRGANTNQSTGTLDAGSKTRTIEATGQLQRAADFRRIIVANRGPGNGAPIRLEQLASVIDGVEDDRNLGWFNNQRGVVLAVQRQPGANTVQVIDDIRAQLPTIRAQIPAGVKLDILYDRSQSIRASLHDVEFTLILAVALVVLVIFLFLRSFRATLIPSAAIPLSIIGTFGVIYLLGFSVNNFTLLALTLAVGFVVDDAIVVLENIVRHIELGDSPWEAALKGGREISFTIVSMTLSLAAVFIPVLFMGGILGRILNEFAVTIAVAILVSGFVSLTLTPMLCSRYLRPRTSKPGRFYLASERLFAGGLAFYERSLRVAMRHHLVVTVTAIAMAAVAVWMFLEAPKGFLPNEDANRVIISTEGEQGIAFDRMIALQQRAGAIVARNPAVEAFVSRVGGNGGSNTGRLILTLKSRAERGPIDDVVRGLRRDLAGIPGLKVFPQNPPAIRIGGTLTKSLYQFTLFGPDLTALYAAAEVMEQRMEKIPGIVDVTSDLQLTSPQVLVEIHRDKASTLGITAGQIEATLGSAYGARQISTIYTSTDQYRVILEADDRFKRESPDLNRLYIRSATTGRLVALNTVAAISQKVGPLTVQHLGQLPAVTLSFDLAKGVSLGEVVPPIERAAADSLDAQISTRFQGTAQAFQSSLGTLGFLLLMAVLVIYLVLGILYESFIHPLTILSGLPSAGFGALLTLWIFGAELNVYGFVGLLMLIGIVKKNAIMMIDFALDLQRREHRAPADAIFEACLVRFRPIMMTTVAAMMGALPIALAYGHGGEARQPLGLVVVGGLLVSQLVTLYLTPILYLYLENLQTRFTRKRNRPDASAEPAPRLVRAS